MICPTKAPIYLDNCATTKMDPRAVEVMLPYFTQHYGNAASNSHAYGWTAQHAVDVAKQDIASLIDARPQEIVLTSGATESNNLALTGFAKANRSTGNHIITCVTEHKSILDTCEALSKDGFEITLLPVDEYGRISLAELEAAIRPETILVSLMMVNNETGTIHPIADIAAICQRHEIRLHVDATQAVGRLPIDLRELPVDLMSFSAHKIYGPKGIGALFVRRSRPRIQLDAIIHGGGHQSGMRSGTLAVPLIVGFGEACRLTKESLVAESTRTRKLRDLLEHTITTAVPGVTINGDPFARSSVVTSLSFPGVDGEELLTDLVGVAASAGSACNSADSKASYVLSAMGKSSNEAGATLRLSVGRFTTEQEVRDAATIVIQTVLSLQGDKQRWRETSWPARRFELAN